MRYVRGRKEKEGTNLQGWIKLYRKILDNEIWSDVTTFRLFTLLLLKAAHQDGVKIKNVELKRGQYLRSYSKLAEDLEYKEKRGYKQPSKSTILRSIKKLINKGMITVKETDNGTLFTVVKYQEYQGFEHDNETINETVYEPLSERYQNEIETLSEQEQELKNLRIKELVVDNTREEFPQSDGAPVTEDKISHEELEQRNKVLADHFIKVRNSGFYLSPKDLNAIERVAELPVKLDTLCNWVTQIINLKNTQTPWDKVKHFSYCEKVIVSKYQKLKHENVIPFNNQKQKREETIEERFARLQREGRIKAWGDGS